MEKFFKLKEHNTTVKTEVMAGITIISYHGVYPRS